MGGDRRREHAAGAARAEGQAHVRDLADPVGIREVIDDRSACVAAFQQHGACAEIQQRAFKDVLLLGMGGSSLCPEVLRMTFGRIPNFPNLHVLDSTDPAQIRNFQARVDLAKTLFLVSSKSGSTLEPNIFKQYFYERAKQAVGAEEAPKRFVAITDPGSSLEKMAQAERFAFTDYLTTLAGPAPQGEAARAFYAKVAQLTGLPVDLVENLLIRSRDVGTAGPAVAEPAAECVRSHRQIAFGIIKRAA